MTQVMTEDQSDHTTISHLLKLVCVLIELLVKYDVLVYGCLYVVSLHILLWFIIFSFMVLCVRVNFAVMLAAISCMLAVVNSLSKKGCLTIYIILIYSVDNQN